MSAIVMQFLLVLAMSYMAFTARYVMPVFGFGPVWQWLFIAGWCLATAAFFITILQWVEERRCQYCGKCEFDPEVFDIPTRMCFTCAEAIGEAEYAAACEEEANAHYAEEERLAALFAAERAAMAAKMRPVECRDCGKTYMELGIPGMCPSCMAEHHQNFIGHTPEEWADMKRHYEENVWVLANDKLEPR